ncbi:MAG: hypothetical protein RLZZ584_450 [Pseudomonadota bacterium]
MNPTGPTPHADVTDADDDLPGRPAAGPQVLEEHDDAGRLSSRTELLDGRPHGLMQQFGPDGRPRLTARYEHGLLHGQLSLFDDAGQPTQVAEYRQGRQHGLTRVFSAGLCIAEQTYAHGLLHGSTVARDGQGHTVLQQSYRRGQPDGQAQFFRDARLVRTAHYRGGLLDGDCVDYDASGAVLQCVPHQANQPHGRARRYWPDGTLMEEIEYQHGKPAAAPARYDRKGHALVGAEATPGLLARIEQLLRG